MPSSTDTAVRVWLVLCALLAGTLASAYVDMGVWNTVANVAFAVVKASLIGYFFMHLAQASVAARFAAAVAVLWLLMLVTLTLADHLSR